MERAVLITGAGGFLAGHFAAEFAAQGWRTIGIGRSDPYAQAAGFDAFLGDSVSASPELTRLLEQRTPAAIIHLAAPSSVARSLREPVDDFIGHVLPTVALLDAVRISGLDTRVVLVSSAAVYGEPRSVPISESAPLVPISPYGFHKLHQELLLDEYTNIHGLRCCKARVFSTYGEKLRRLAVWEIACRALAGDLRVYGTGEETRDYLYVADVARAIVCIVENAACRGEAINVASGESVTIRVLATQIFKHIGLTQPPQFSGAPLPGNPVHWRADVSQLRALGCHPGEWARGLPRVIDWIRRESRPRSR